MYYLTERQYHLITHLSSMFEGVNVLGPSQKLIINKKNIPNYKQHSFQKYYDYETKGSFYEKLTYSVSKILEKHDDTSLMLSGGLDSILLGMAIEDSGIKPKSFTYWRSASGDNNPLKAQFFAKKLNWEHHIVEDDEYLPSGKASEHLFSLMKNDLINPKNPHWGKTPYESTYSLSGQNADTLAVLTMTKRKVFDLVGGPKGALMPYLFFIKNLLYTDNALNNPKLTSAIYNTALLPAKDWKFKKDFFVEGMAAYSMPFRNPKFHSHKQAISLFSEVYKTLTSNKKYTNKDLADLFPFNSYMASFLSFLQKYNNFENRKVLLPYTSGPVVSHFFAQKRGMKDAWSTKHEFVAEVSKRLNAPFDKLMKEVPKIQDSKNFRYVDNMEPCNIMKDFLGKYQDKTIKLLDYTNTWSDEASQKLEEYIDYVAEKIKSGKLNSEESTKIYRLVNVELLLSSE